MSAPSLNRLPPFILRACGQNFQHFLPILLLIGVSAVPVSVIMIVLVFKHGHTSAFPPGDPHVGWTKGPDSRGTFNIIWLCATTIFTSVYVTVHIDVPRDDAKDGEPRETTWKILKVYSWLWRKIKPNLRKAYWVVFNIFAPELMVFVAFCERESAKSGVAFMHGCEQTTWMLRHAFFADMRGFKDKLPKPQRGQQFSTGFSFYEWYVGKNCPSLDFKEIERDIKDKSKKDTLLKVFAIFQAAWFIVETIERFAQHQPVSPLEITTCSYIVCAIITQFCWLRKPYGVNRSRSIHVEAMGRDIPMTTLPQAPPPALPASATSGNGFDELNRSESGVEDEEEQSMQRTTARTTLESRTHAPDEQGHPRAILRVLFADAGMPCTPFNRAYSDPRRAILCKSLQTELVKNIDNIFSRCQPLRLLGRSHRWCHPYRPILEH